MTSIPRTFQEKLENGEISFMVGNVATTDVSSLGDFDFVSCMNMLYMLPKEGQQLALWNMIQSLKKPHGTMLINDGLDGLEHTKIPLLSQFGGWLNPDVASNMYSSELRLWSKDSFYLSALLTRNQ